MLPSLHSGLELRMRQQTPELHWHHHWPIYRPELWCLVPTLVRCQRQSRWAEQWCSNHLRHEKSWTTTINLAYMIHWHKKTLCTSCTLIFFKTRYQIIISDSDRPVEGTLIQWKWRRHSFWLGTGLHRLKTQRFATVMPGRGSSSELFSTSLTT